MAALPPLNRDYERRPYWHSTMPAIPERAGKPLPEVVDVVVVGGGYTGVAAARQLASQGAKVALLEANHLGGHLVPLADLLAARAEDLVDAHVLFLAGLRHAF